MTYKLFIKIVDSKFNSASYKSQLRYGQYIMNELYNIWPEKYAEITGSKYDCFYDNTLVQSTLFKLEKDWIDNDKKRLKALEKLSELDQQLGLQ